MNRRNLTWARIGLLAAGFGLVSVSTDLRAGGRIHGPGRTQTRTIRGTVVDDQGPVTGAIVRIQATEYATETAKDGSFELHVPPLNSGAIHLTASAKGYYIGGTTMDFVGTGDVTIQLKAHTQKDHPGYEWIPARPVSAGDAERSCMVCHSSRGTDLSFDLPFDEWQEDAHSRSATNPRFLTMYLGSDVYGRMSPPTSYRRTRDYGRVPIPPDPEEPYYGPGYRLDFPNTTGNCAACHAPLQAVDSPYQIDPSTLSGTAKEGISCDLCHKAWDVCLDLGTRVPFDNMPGVLSMEFRRPPPGKPFFAGPYDDVPGGKDVYSPLHKSSQFCAPCHYGKFWDTVVYNSYGEWLNSPYSDSRTGKSCQDCHMPHIGATHSALPEKGAPARSPETIFSHRMPGASDRQLLQNAVTLDVTAEDCDAGIRVVVSITNDRTGHDIPTGSPMRHLILLVRATDSNGRELSLLKGPILPEWCGRGEPENRNLAGLPGKAFAKVLEELWTEKSPTAAYWNPTRVVTDNRIAPYTTERSTYIFALPISEGATIHAQLLYRRAFIELTRQKGWNIQDILMEEEIHTLSPPLAPLSP